MTNIRTIEEINRKISNGDAVVLTTQEMTSLVEEKGVKIAAQEVDVVTTGTFGAMCSSGAVINLGHADPPIKIQRAWINDVEVSHPGAAVDLYIGATHTSDTQPLEYGGGHIIHELIEGKQVELRAIAYGTDCYPRTRLKTTITKDDLNQFYLLNFRNGYQRYNCATNSRDETIYTYMGKLLPHHRNATFSGSGCFNPLCNDPSYETIGTGTRIFLGGTQGYIIGEGTQHDPGGRFGNLMVKGDCKKMSSEYIRGASFTNYGNTLYVGLGIPIPILNESLAKQTAVTDEEIFTNIVDYGVPRRSRPTLGKVSYKQLKSGSVILQNKEVKVSPLSSLKKAHEIADLLKKWINNAQFYLTSPVETLPKDTTVKPMKQTQEVIFVEALIKPAVTCMITESITDIAERLISRSVNHIIVIDDTGRLIGIVTSWDITRAIANGLTKLPDIITTRVVTSDPNEPIEAASRRMAQNNISALPVVDQNKIVLGILTSEDLSKLIGR